MMNIEKTPAPSVIGRIPERLLLGPGPSNAPQSVLDAAAQPLLGHLDPFFSTILQELQAMLRAVFRTENLVTYAVSGTGSAGMQTLAANLFEPGDTVLVGRNGVFGTRICDALQRMAVEVVPIDAPWGSPIRLEDIEQAWRRTPRPTALWIVHAETSTGLLQPDMQAIGEFVHRNRGLFLVDCVTSLGGAPVEIDAWHVDAAFSGTQKCLNVAPGLAPVTFNERALRKVAARNLPVTSWYFDLDAIRRYWIEQEGGGRLYHHTAPISSIYSLHEGLRLVLEEGLEARWNRHRRMAGALQAGLTALGFTYRVKEASHRAPMLHAVTLPPDLESAVRPKLLAEHGIEVGAGLAAWAADTWRIGLMGVNASEEVVLRLVDTLEKYLPAKKGAGRKAAEATLQADGG